MKGTCEMSFDADQLKDALSAIQAILPTGLSEPIQLELTERQLKNLLQNIMSTANQLLRLADRLDPIQLPTRVFDLKDPRITGMLIGKALVEVEPTPLNDIPRFYGSGVYAIYYKGDFKLYAPIKGEECPIYVGKADPDKRDAISPREQGPALFARLTKHAKNLSNAKHLSIDDFTCRYLVIQSGLQVATEEYLIQEYKPLWNGVVKGLGKHGDLARKELSAWDILHSGREWASNQESLRGKTPETVAREILSHFTVLAANEHLSKLLNPDWIKRHKER